MSLTSYHSTRSVQDAFALHERPKRQPRATLFLYALESLFYHYERERGGLVIVRERNTAYSRQRGEMPFHGLGPSL